MLRKSKIPILNDFTTQGLIVLGLIIFGILAVVVLIALFCFVIFK